VADDNKDDIFFPAGVENPPLPVVQRFVHLLDQRATDFAEEIGELLTSDKKCRF